MKFFISSTYTDLKIERSVVINILKGIMGHTTDITGKVVAMEYFCANERTSKEVCLEELQASDVVIGIYGERYGSIDIETGKSMTELEFDYAVKYNKPILAFVLRTTNREALEDKFVEDKIYKSGFTCAHYKSATELADRLNDSLESYLGTLEGYSITSLWYDVKKLKDEISKDLQKEVPDNERQMDPYIYGEEELAIEHIIECALGIKSFIRDISCENKAVYAYAYKYRCNPKNLSTEDEKEMSLNVQNNAELILKNWESIHLGLNNTTTKIILATTFLNLCRMQTRLLVEPWTDKLRQEVIRVRDFYYNTILNSQHID